jgi:hypothetical protein
MNQAYKLAHLGTKMFHTKCIFIYNMLPCKFHGLLTFLSAESELSALRSGRVAYCPISLDERLEGSLPVMEPIVTNRSPMALGYTNAAVTYFLCVLCTKCIRGGHICPSTLIICGTSPRILIKCDIRISHLMLFCEFYYCIC